MATSSVLALAAANPPTKPNIIFIDSDDVGLGDIGCCGGPFKTPHIDVLAKGGTRFELCYSTPLCGPSRCQSLTGRYPFRTGLINNQSHDAVSPSREVMIPKVMKKAGYVTASVGKWGQICLGPGEWGFDEYLVFQGSGRYWREQRPGYQVNAREKELGEGQYLPRPRPGDGRAAIIWDGADRDGTPVEPGVYLYRLEAGTLSEGGKIVRVQSFHETKATLDAVYASGRLQLPFEGVLLFGS